MSEETKLKSWKKIAEFKQKKIDELSAAYLALREENEKLKAELEYLKQRDLSRTIEIMGL